MKKTIEECIARAEELIANSDPRLHAGMVRRAVSREWQGNRTYINIYCYSLAGNYKGKYDCGYVDMATGEYTTNRYTEINLFED